jgi:branched-chain amino acid transport system permease protein
MLRRPARWTWPWGAAAAGLLAALVVPLVLPDAYWMRVLNVAMLYMILSMSLALIDGFTGQPSLGHAAFYGVGAYTSALGMLNLGLPFPVAALAATAVTGVLGLCVGPITRLRGFYLALATLALGQVVYLLFLNVEPITRGPIGVRGIPPASIGPLVLANDGAYYYLILAAVVLTYVVMKRITTGQLGRILSAIRQNELSTAAMGVNTTRYKVQIFGIGCAFAGLAGSLYAHLVNFISPNAFLFQDSITIVAMTVVGGMRSFEGAILGALVLGLLPEVARPLKDFRLLVYGFVFLLFMVYLPGGIVGLLRDLARVLARRAAAARPAAQPDPALAAVDR